MKVSVALQKERKVRGASERAGAKGLGKGKAS